MSRVLGFPAFAVCAFLAMAGVANAQTYTAFLTPAQEVPAAASTATGYGRVFIDEGAGTLTFTVVFTGLSGGQTLSHIHKGAIGANGPIEIDFGTVGGSAGTITGTRAVTPAQIADIREGRDYINVHSGTFPGGEIRGQLGVRRALDYDGDGQTDYAVLRWPGGPPSPVTQYNLNSTTGSQAVTWGERSTDFPCPGDYDGDGQDDFCAYRDGETPGAQSVFFILRSSDGGVRVVAWGHNGDNPVARDYDGDGITDIATFRRGAAVGEQAFWWIIESRTNTVRVVPWGTTGNNFTTFDMPQPEDYDADGKVDIAVYRVGLAPANTFIILRSSDGQVRFDTFGNFSTDYVVPGDFDGDGKADYTVARTGGSQLVWWTLQSSNSEMRVVPFGLSSDFPAPGDYDGDGKTDITVTRSTTPPETGQKIFYTTGSFAAAFIVRQWGVATDFVLARFHII